MPLLYIEKGPDKGQSVVFQEICTIGRNEDCLFRPNDNAISRNHFKISRKQDQYYIEDAKSLNGTLLNGESVVRPMLLKEGDKIAIGETLFLWQMEVKKAEDPLLQKELAGYRILERLGKGGMGIVYLAKQLSLQRDVALKILTSEKGDDQNFIQRFLEEARACANLNHPNIIQVYDAGQAAGYFYYSMEYAQGGSIQHLIAGGKSLPWEEALPFLRDTATGLEYAERKKIVHRDIKPDNLFLTEDKKVKIGDLGLVKRIDEKSLEEESNIYGTPHFVAPEQIKKLNVDHRADIYSLGATFYRIFAGKPPFQANNVRAILLKQLNEKAPSLKSFLSGFPAELSDMIDKMMQKNPDLRYASNTEIIEGLQKFSKRLITNKARRKIHSERNPALKVERTQVHKVNRAKMTTAISRRELGKRMREQEHSRGKKFLSLFIPIVLVNAIVFFGFTSSWIRCSPSKTTIATPTPHPRDSSAKKEYMLVYHAYEKEGATPKVVAAMKTIQKNYANTEWGQKAAAFLQSLEAKKKEQKKPQKK